MRERVMHEQDEAVEQSAPAEYREPDGSLVVNTRDGAPGADQPGPAPASPPVDDRATGEVPVRDRPAPGPMSATTTGPAASDATEPDMTRTGTAEPDMTRTGTAEPDMTRTGATGMDATPAGGQPTADGAAPAGRGLWPEQAASGLRERWRDVQLGFVDDPHSAAAEADRLLGEAIDTLTARLADQRAELAGWHADGADATEQLRVHITRYRQLLDHVLSL